MLRKYEHKRKHKKSSIKLHEEGLADLASSFSKKKKTKNKHRASHDATHHHRQYYNEQPHISSKSMNSLSLKKKMFEAINDEIDSEHSDDDNKDIINNEKKQMIQKKKDKNK